MSKTKKKEKKAKDGGKSTRVVLEVSDAGNLSKLAMAFPRTFEAKRVISEPGQDAWRCSFDPAEEAKGVMGATAFILDPETGSVEVFNPYAKQDGPSLDHLADLVAMAEDPFRWLGTQTGRFSSAAPNEANESKDGAEFGIHEDVLERWAEVDFEGLERRVNSMRDAKGRFAKSYVDGFAEGMAEGMTSGNPDADDVGLLEGMVERLDVLEGKVEAGVDNAEDNLGRIREVQGMVREMAEGFNKRLTKLEQWIDRREDYEAEQRERA